ncbi:hypothetical protein P154DRAFT_579237 [Amniculicola lignicola CBS 123094]|uniref:Uncharacterized protein n=1 Tax=Amniculicola lignicola CBS 123094 TaxID=1392246 RepID=A0A6A5W5G6_9PLEO|nr:hypothetical protein P154DRAFT_579237 [Amniculicola lignicola CBS 123094]
MFLLTTLPLFLFSPSTLGSPFPLSSPTTTTTTTTATNTTTTPLPAPAPNPCWNDTRVRCPGHSSPLSTAILAIHRACAQIPSCLPDPARAGQAVPRYFGKVPGYTARIDIGWNCGGVGAGEWSTETCFGLFEGRIDGGCGGDGGGMFKLGYTGASCDGSYLSFNFGG